MLPMCEDMFFQFQILKIFVFAYISDHWGGVFFSPSLSYFSYNYFAKKWTCLKHIFILHILPRGRWRDAAAVRGQDSTQDPVIVICFCCFNTEGRLNLWNLFDYNRSIKHHIKHIFILIIFCPGDDDEMLPMCEDKIVRKTLFHLMSTLEASFYPMYDFSDSKATDFAREPSIPVSWYI